MNQFNSTRPISPHLPHSIHFQYHLVYHPIVPLSLFLVSHPIVTLSLSISSCLLSNSISLSSHLLSNYSTFTFTFDIISYPIQFFHFHFQYHPVSHPILPVSFPWPPTVFQVTHKSLQLFLLGFASLCPILIPFLAWIWEFLMGNMIQFRWFLTVWIGIEKLNCQFYWNEW